MAPAGPSPGYLRSLLGTCLQVCLCVLLLRVADGGARISLSVSLPLFLSFGFFIVKSLQTPSGVIRAALTKVLCRGRLAMLRVCVFSVCFLRMRVFWCWHGDQHRAACSPVLPRTHWDAPSSLSCFPSGFLCHTSVGWEGMGPSCGLCLWSQCLARPLVACRGSIGSEPGAASSPACWPEAGHHPALLRPGTLILDVGGVYLLLHG